MNKHQEIAKKVYEEILQCPATEIKGFYSLVFTDSGIWGNFVYQDVLTPNFLTDNQKCAILLQIARDFQIDLYALLMGERGLWKRDGWTT